MTTSLTFTIPKVWWISANDRTHWAVKARATRNLRTLAASSARDLEPVGTVHVAAFIGYLTGGRADPVECCPDRQGADRRHDRRRRMARRRQHPRHRPHLPPRPEVQDAGSLHRPPRADLTGSPLVMSIPTTQTLGIVHHPDAAERATICDNIRRLARDEADAELLCAAMGVDR